MGQHTTNPDVEAKIEEMVHDLAYKRVRESYLFNVLPNWEADNKAEELAEKIAQLMEAWIFAEVNAEAQRQSELDEFVANAQR